jgi:hypothetical protein
MSVDIILYCDEGKHEFTKQFLDPVDWQVVNAWLNTKQPCCDEHQQVYWYDE